MPAPHALFIFNNKTKLNTSNSNVRKLTKNYIQKRNHKKYKINEIIYFLYQ